MAPTEAAGNNYSARGNSSPGWWIRPAGPKPPEPTGTADRDAKEGESIPIRGRRTAGPVQRDKTAKFIVAGIGGLLVLLMMIFLFTDKAKPPQRPKAQAPGTARLERKPESTGASIVPDVGMKPNPEDSKKSGQLTSTDIERTRT